MNRPDPGSFANDGAAAVLWQALSSVENGRYFEVGASDPTTSVSRVLHDAGWSGAFAEPAGTPAADLGIAEAWDACAALAPDASQAVQVLLLGPDSDVDSVIAALDLKARRPWVIVAAGWDAHTAIVAAGYTLTLFYGAVRVYASTETPTAIAQALSHPVAPLEGSTSARIHECESELTQARADARHWQSVALGSWSESLQSRPDVDDEIAALHSTLSWRITKPLRIARTIQLNRRKAGR